MAKSGKLSILYGESDEELQASTAQTLEQAGHSVEKAIGRKAVEAAFGKGSFDLVILGQTMSRNDRHHLPYSVKKMRSDVKVLVMHADGSRHPYVDLCTDTGSTADHVLAKLDESKVAETKTPAAKPLAAKAAAGR